MEHVQDHVQFLTSRHCNAENKIIWLVIKQGRLRNRDTIFPLYAANRNRVISASNVNIALCLRFAEDTKESCRLPSEWRAAFVEKISDWVSRHLVSHFCASR